MLNRLLKLVIQNDTCGKKSSINLTECNLKCDDTLVDKNSVELSKEERMASAYAGIEQFDGVSPLLSPSSFNTVRKRFSEAYYKSKSPEKRPRLVQKCGELNINMESVPKHKRRLLSDFFNTILDIKWRWHVIIFLLTFLLSWVIFAMIWYMIAYLHGDLDQSQVHTPDTAPEQFTPTRVIDQYSSEANQIIHHLNQLIQLLNHSDHVTRMEEFQDAVPKRHMPCVHGIHDLKSALLFSVETQHTIGYGLRYITEECSFAIIFLMLQACFGIFIQGLVAGVVFAKISRPNKRKRTIIFSHNACISERDGRLCFMFKIGNVISSQLSDAKVKCFMIKARKTSENEFIPFQTYMMKVNCCDSDDSGFFPWPTTLEHIINEESPFYDMCKHYLRGERDILNSSSIIKSCYSSAPSSPSSSPILSAQQTQQTNLTMSQTKPQPARHEDFEIVVILEGNIETTGASCHIRTSYLPQEILFGYRFVPVYPHFTSNEYLFDYSKFNQVEPVQQRLFHLNVAHVHRNLNLVQDTKQREDKNYQMTCQNTLSKEDYERLGSQRKDTTSFFGRPIRKSDNKRFVPIEAIITSFSTRDVNIDSTDDSSTPVVNVEQTTTKNGRFTVIPVSEQATATTHLNGPILNPLITNSTESTELARILNDTTVGLSKAFKKSI